MIAFYRGEADTSEETYDRLIDVAYTPDTPADGDGDTGEVSIRAQVLFLLYIGIGFYLINDYILTYP